MAKRINSIHITRLPKAAHVVFIGDILDCAQKDETVSAECYSCVSALQRAYEVEQYVLVVSQKSFHTDKIVEADRERGQIFMAMKKTILNFLRLPFPSLSQPAMILNQKIKDLGIRPKMQLDEETGLLHAFISDLTENHAAEVDALSFTPLLHALKDANDRVSQYSVLRREERMCRRKGAFQQARRVSDEAYRKLVRNVNARALIEGDARYSAFIDYANEVIRRFRQEFLCYVGRNKKVNGEDI